MPDMDHPAQECSRGDDKCSASESLSVRQNEFVHSTEMRTE